MSEIIKEPISGAMIDLLLVQGAYRAVLNRQGFTLY